MCSMHRPYALFTERQHTASSPREILLNNHVPVVNVLYATILDTLQVIVHLLACFANLHAVVVGNVVIQVIQSTNGRDNGSSTTSTSLLECRELLNRNIALLNNQAEVSSNLTKALVGD